MGAIDNRLKEYCSRPYPTWIPATAQFTCEYLLENSLIQKIEQGEYAIASEHFSSPQGQAEIAQSNAQLISLFSCFKNRIFKPAWNSFQKIDTDEVIAPIWFCLAIYNSFPDTITKPLTAKKAENWKMDMLSALESARATAEKTPQNYFEWTAKLESVMSGQSEVLSDDDQRQLYFYSPCTVLAKLIYTLEATESNLAYYKNHIESDYARRAYFTRSLTTAFLQRYGYSDNGLIADVVNNIFEINIFDLKQIDKITAELKAQLPSSPIVRKRLVTRILIAYKQKDS